MNVITSAVPTGGIVYPESDGQPMAENTQQLRWIVVLFGNLSAIFRERLDVFVAADLLWYPQEGHPEVRVAPDVFVAFGRPKGDRGSYRQWEEENVAVTVVFEILSPGNKALEMMDKHSFYEEHGVEEYYVYDPESNRLHIYQRRGDVLLRVRQIQGFVSPRLGIRFDLTGEEMVVWGPNGRRFLTFEELEVERQVAEQRAEHAMQRAEHAEQRAEHAEQRTARLVELSRKARLQQASAEELQELERLESESFPPS